MLLILLCFGLLPQAQAVVPPPDGGYPNFTTAEGQNALFSLTTGGANTAVGWFSLKSVTTGSFNTGVGAGTLVLNTGDENTAVGAAALLLNTATGNTAVGSRALLNNTTGGTLGNIQGVDVGPNVAVGQQALESNTAASANIAVGYQALQSFTTGPIGLEQIGLCTAVGFQALANATGNGFANSAFGYHALVNNTAGGANTAIGLQALANNTIGSANVAIGNNALFSSTGNDNIALGSNAGSGLTTGNNVICIGALGANVNDSCFIGNIFGVTSVSGIGVFINSNGQLGTSTSSRRFKEEIKSMEQDSEGLYRLRPVTFRYKKEIDPEGRQQFGLVAEDVEKLSPDLVARDQEGKPYSVRYDQVNAMLLNEFLKEHARVEEQQATIAQLKQEVETVVVRLKAQDSEIETMKAQIQANVVTPRVVANEP